MVRNSECEALLNFYVLIICFSLNVDSDSSNFICRISKGYFAICINRCANVICSLNGVNIICRSNSGIYVNLIFFNTINQINITNSEFRSIFLDSQRILSSNRIITVIACFSSNNINCTCRMNSDFAGCCINISNLLGFGIFESIGNSTCALASTHNIGEFIVIIVICNIIRIFISKDKILLSSLDDNYCCNIRCSCIIAIITSLINLNLNSSCFFSGYLTCIAINCCTFRAFNDRICNFTIATVIISNIEHILRIRIIYDHVRTSYIKRKLIRFLNL